MNFDEPGYFDRYNFIYTLGFNSRFPRQTLFSLCRARTNESRHLIDRIAGLLRDVVRVSPEKGESKARLAIVPEPGGSDVTEPRPSC
ncbi:MAG TPA: hypothetical protein VN822_11425, partial [Candidatus Acidoferrales bacterium]|nr:hypothetical protein [Candidatus Acidoferrales bacterium]